MTGFGRSLGVFCAICLFTAICAASANAQKAEPPSVQELMAISERGILLNEYDQAAWHASDAVQTANPKTIEGQRWVAKKENDKWTVAFGKLNAEKTAFEIHYEAVQQTKPQEFSVKEITPPEADKSFYLFAARAIEIALADFRGEKRPYNYAVLPASRNQLYIYIYPAQTKPRIYPLGGDVRYLISADGMKILEKRLLHKSTIEPPPPDKGRKPAAGFHSHVLSDLPEDTDVFHVLTQDPRLPEYVGTQHFVYKILSDGTITVEKEKK
ncbi:MAG: hypothetical protein JSS69_11760 [Acidobacteria bacterium]|nr:hypothetical protein [Acidobacteriota bacterium]MBS1866579.1 hypothetical protein [Acidobacteriota bacterium]